MTRDRERIAFLVQSSDLEPYTVSFERRRHELAAFCTCPAGSAGQACKHRTSILFACVDGIVSPNVSAVGTVCEWFHGSSLRECYDAVAAAEDACKQAKADLSEARRTLNARMHRKW